MLKAYNTMFLYIKMTKKILILKNFPGTLILKLTINKYFSHNLQNIPKYA